MKVGILAALCSCILFFCFTNATADEFAGTNDIIKISMNDTVKRAKEFGSGNGIEFVLPDFQDPSFYLYSIELAVFEKQDGTQWHIYTDAAGNESKRQMIEYPQSLKIQLDFGNVSEYRSGARYKVAYRYYVRAIDDLSQITIAGGEDKEGWRLVGETDPLKASEQGFTFYVNAIPTLTIDRLSFQSNDMSGAVTRNYTPEQIADAWLPATALKDGLTVQYTASDIDSEDLLAVSYKLLDMTGTILAQGTIENGGIIQTTAALKNAELIFSVIDNWGSSYTCDKIPIRIDRELPQVTKEFDDQGYAVRGLNLYSKFTITDDAYQPLKDGKVYYSIFNNGTVLESNILLPSNPSGEYMVDRQVPQSGTYEVELTIFDKAGNKQVHTLNQTLDSTAPVIRLLSKEENTDASRYNSWSNQSGNIILTAYDQHAGILRTKIYENDEIHEINLDSPEREHTFIYPISSELTGKISYYISVYDGAMALDKAGNTVKVASGGGTRANIETEVWIDKTPPTVTINADEERWYNTPSTFSITAGDFESMPGAGDASGIKSLEYCVTDTPGPDDSWRLYQEQGVEINRSGVHYLHARATDIAGNVRVVSKRIRFNTPSVILRGVAPTEDTAYTIYQQTSANGLGVYVAKNTAYQTKYHFTLMENDLQDMIQVDIRFVNEDNAAISARTSFTVPPTGNAVRDAVFPVSYLMPDGASMPDGVYMIYLTIKEIKNNETEIITHQEESGCEVIIKRSPPPTPIITAIGGGEERAIEIEYPQEPLSGSLNRSYIRELYKRQYKAVLDGSYASNTYLNYTNPITAIINDCLITALYTDPAGNISTASLRVFADDGSSEGGDTIRTDGNTVNIEESRPATVYYINTRRDKQGGINGNALGFLK